ncbi:MAG: hypothetical protein A3J28_03035 [Acidobacteria bacterium RIFCSPLOWO2_12_FULL_60_22]|nr:MAG: hypothetical protein A3J28_03035 [Acidobacteria bacterium RIFCSPLOWO2_12_FULL_60_22]
MGFNKKGTESYLESLAWIIHEGRPFFSSPGVHAWVQGDHRLFPARFSGLLEGMSHWLTQG